MGENIKSEMKNRIKWLLAGVLIGIVLGSWAWRLGTQDSCVGFSCIDGVKVLPVTDQQYMDNVLPLVEGAQKSIFIAAFHIKYYESHPASNANLLVRRLIYAHERGLDVRVVTDEYSTENNAHSILFENGVGVRFDGKERTLHAKLIIIDGEIVVLGSTNFSHYGIDRNMEANVLIHDKEVARYFENIWDNGIDFIQS